MKRLHVAVLVAGLVAALDAVTTYFLIASGLGVEANPLLQLFNDAPAAVFVVQAFSILLLALTLKLFEATAGKLPPALEARLYKVFYVAFAVAVTWRTAVVANNIMGIVTGVTPLGDFFVGSA